MPEISLAESDLLVLIKGDGIASGCHREVFEYQPDTSNVVKLEKAGYKFDNITEWEIWNELRDTPYKEWLAECRTISPNGLALIQERTMPVPRALLPKQIPSIFMDTKAENWGMVVRNGRKHIVCHDYAHSRVLNVPKKIRLVKADWFDPTYKGWSK